MERGLGPVMKLEGNLGIFIPFDIRHGEKWVIAYQFEQSFSYFSSCFFFSPRDISAPLFFHTVRSKVFYPIKLFFLLRTRAPSFLRSQLKILLSGSKFNYSSKNGSISMDLSSNEKKEKPEAKYNKIFPLISLQDPSSVGSLSDRQIPCLIRQLSRRIRASLSKILQSSPRVWSYSANNAQSWRWSRRDIVRVTRACVWSAPSPQRLRGEWPRIRPDSTRASREAPYSIGRSY